jgi:glutamyl-tRNA synthetase
MGSSPPPVGRLAPSPTGAQHVGNARTYLIAWALNRQMHGKLFCRIEDLDTPRVKPWAIEQAVRDLQWLGLDWDSFEARNSGVDFRSSIEPPPYTWLQSQRHDRYREILQRLKDMEIVYPCTCTRSEIDELSSAPHESNLDGQRYHGRCSKKSVSDAAILQSQGVSFSWRFRMPKHSIQWSDMFMKDHRLGDPQKSLGDFVIARRDGGPAYQLAVVIDDHDMGVTQVVRGDDLVYSTFRQIAILDALSWEIPAYCHVPLVIGKDGHRLAKRHGDTRIDKLRAQGVTPEALIGFLVYLSGWIEEPKALPLDDSISLVRLDNLRPKPIVFDLETDLPILLSLSK